MDELTLVIDLVLAVVAAFVGGALAQRFGQPPILGYLLGGVALGILIVQDLAVVPMVVVLPALAVGGAGLLGQLGLAALKAAGVLLGAWVVGGRLVPWALDRAAISRSRELFLLGVVGLAL